VIGRGLVRAPALLAAVHGCCCAPPIAGCCCCKRERERVGLETAVWERGEDPGALLVLGIGFFWGMYL
jgi:hypothetical protein